LVAVVLVGMLAEAVIPVSVVVPVLAEAEVQP